MAETGDNILLHVPLKGGFVIRQTGGREVECRAGEVYIDPSEVSGIARFTLEDSTVLYVSIPRSMFAAATQPRFRDVVQIDPHWRMLVGYARLLHAEADQLPAAGLDRCTAHLNDLMLMALGAGGETRHVANGRGVRAARLRAIQADIEENLSRPGLSPAWIAARQGISTRYLCSLFSDEGTSFSDYVADRRLHCVGRRLADRRYGRHSISQIAYDCGFGDISWFNARFRSAFGMTPSEFRATRSLPPTP